MQNLSADHCDRRALIAPVLGSQVLVVTDCSFIAKSGKQTYGLDTFRNASLARNESLTIIK